MKTFNVLSFLLCSLTFAQAQSQNSPALLSAYLDIKNALVASKLSEATEGAQKLLLQLKDFSTAGLTEEQAKIWETQKASLLTSTESILVAKNLEKQRTAFAALSVDFWMLAKALNPRGETIYYDYCPMKKTYWISKEEPIKNPYYGSSMLTCGKVTEKIN